FQHIEYLGQLIDAGIADELAYTRHPAVVLLRPLRPAILFRIHAHAAELVHAKHPAAVAHTLLAVDQRGAQPVFELDCNDRDQHEWPGYQQQGQTRDDVEAALEHIAHRRKRKPLGEHQPARRQRANIELPRFPLHEGEIVDDIHTLELAVEQLIEREIIAIGTAPLIHRHHDFLNLILATELQQWHGLEKFPADRILLEPVPLPQFRRHDFQNPIVAA